MTDDVATDAVTQLQWQRHTPDDTFTWPEAEQYCGCLTLAGYDDWQLPSRMELVSIVDYTKQSVAQRHGVSEHAVRVVLDGLADGRR